MSQATKAPVGFQFPMDQMPLGERWGRLIKGVRDNTLVFPPAAPPAGTPAPTASCLLLLLPGGLMKPENYRALAEAVAAAAATYQAQTGLAVWVAVPDVDLFPLYQYAQAVQNEGATTAPPSPGPPSAETGASPTDCLTATRVIFDTAVASAVEAAARLGGDHKLEVQRTNSGRYGNVVLAAHSASGCVFSDTAYRNAAGLVLLESSWSDQVLATFQRPVGWGASSRPTLVLAGELDGQMTWSNQLQEAAVSAYTAVRHGAASAAATKPYVVIPGLNHAQMCGQASMAHRGDCVTSAPAEDTLGAAGQSVAAFLAVNWAPRPAGARFNLSIGAPQAALTHLKDLVKSTAQFYEAYSQAMGMGSLSAAWDAGEALDAQTRVSTSPTGQPVIPRPAALAPNVGVPLATGGLYGGASVGPAGQPLTMISQAVATGPLSHGVPVVYPQTVAAAEQEVADLQMLSVHKAVEGGLLPGDVLGRVRVVANVHPTLDGLLYSQPLLTVTPGGVVEITVQAFMHWPALDRAPMEPIGFTCASHGLWIKTKTPAALALEVRDLLGLDPLPVDTCTQVTIDARTLNQSALDWALAHVSQDVRERYSRQGVPLELCADRPVPSPAVWVRTARMTFELVSPTAPSPDVDGTTGGSTAASRAVHVTSPVVDNGAQLGKVSQGVPESLEDRRFWGGLYVKVLSRAQAVEWVTLGAVRYAGLPDTAPCKWGGTEPPALDSSPFASPPASPPAAKASSA